MGKSKFFYGWIIVMISFLMLLMTSGVTRSFGFFMHPIIRDLGLDRTAFSLVVSSFMLVQGLIAPFVGRFIDRYGPKKVVSFGVLLLGLSMILMSQISTYIAFFAVQGILAAVAYSTTSLLTISVLISKWFKEKKGLALGISTAGLPLSTLVIAPIIGGLIILVDWRWSAFILGASLIGILLPLVFFSVKESPNNINEGNSSEKKSNLKIKFLRLLSNAQYVKLAGSYFGCGFTMALVTTHLPIHTLDLGLNEIVAATVFALMGGTAALGTITSGALSDKYGRKNLLTSVYLVRFLALLTFFYADSANILYLGAIIFGLSWTATGPLTTALAGDIWGSKVLGTIFGYVFLGHQLGAASGSFLGGLIFDYTNSYQLAFLLGALVLLSSAANSYFINESKAKLDIDGAFNYAP